MAAITPWNVPLFLAAAKLSPALLSGSTVVFKPAPETPLDANVLAEILADAGLPKGVLSVVPAGREVGEYLVNHPGVNKVSFTGSTAAGRKIGAACGANLKRFSLELGGKSAAILLDDVDLADVHSADDAQRHHEQRRGLHLPHPDPRSSGPLRRGRPRPWSSRCGP